MNAEQLIKNSVKKNSENSVVNVSQLGNGASGSVYRVTYDNEHSIAVKISKHPELMKKEFDMLLLLKEKTESKIGVPFIRKLVPQGGFCSKNINFSRCSLCYAVFSFDRLLLMCF